MKKIYKARSPIIDCSHILFKNCFFSIYNVAYVLKKYTG